MRIAGGRNAGLAFALAMSLGLAACITVTPPPSTAAAEGATVVFESVDGPPRPIAQRLARSLDHEAATRRLAVVAPGSAAAYRIRGYLAAYAEGGSTTLAWAFDVYDAERRRAFRLRGEARAAGTGAWNAADDAMLQRIAAAGIAELVAFIAADRAGSATAAAAPSPTGPGQAARPLAGARLLAYSDAN
ncbi:MAG: hypothetical protein IT536_17015 [Hyphomicrobiales bacterium]|nr:hypothetical protein [Hyphomicrobiales bacterium]